MANVGKKRRRENGIVDRYTSRSTSSEEGKSRARSEALC